MNNWDGGGDVKHGRRELQVLTHCMSLLSITSSSCLLLLILLLIFTLVLTLISLCILLFLVHILKFYIYSVVHPSNDFFIFSFNH